MTSNNGSSAMPRSVSRKRKVEGGTKVKALCRGRSAEADMMLDWIVGIGCIPYTSSAECYRRMEFSMP